MEKNHQTKEWCILHRRIYFHLVCQFNLNTLEYKREKVKFMKKHKHVSMVKGVLLFINNY